MWLDLTLGGVLVVGACCLLLRSAGTSRCASLMSVNERTGMRWNWNGRKNCNWNGCQLC